MCECGTIIFKYFKPLPTITMSFSDAAIPSFAEQVLTQDQASQTSQTSQEYEEHSSRTITLHGYSQHSDHQYRASQINYMMNTLIDKAMQRITSELGFDIFSRDLSDYEHAYSIVIPKDLYYDESPTANDFRDTLERWVKAIFNTHYIYIETEWRESSLDPDSDFSAPLYEVDCCGSRSREINIGPHLYFTCSMRCTATRRPPLDVAPASQVWPEGIPYKWSVITEQPDDAIVHYITGEFVARKDLNATIAAAIAYAETQLAEMELAPPAPQELA